MREYNPIAANPLNEEETPPPQELTWDSTILELLQASYNFSDNLIDTGNPPEFIRMYADRWSVRWNKSGVEEPENQSAIDIFINVRPVYPAEITIKT